MKNNPNTTVNESDTKFKVIVLYSHGKRLVDCMKNVLINRKIKI